MSFHLCGPVPSWGNGLQAVSSVQQLAPRLNNDDKPQTSQPLFSTKRQKKSMCHPRKRIGLSQLTSPAPAIFVIVYSCHLPLWRLFPFCPLSLKPVPPCFATLWRLFGNDSGAKKCQSHVKFWRFVVLLLDSSSFITSWSFFSSVARQKSSSFFEECPGSRSQYCPPPECVTPFLSHSLSSALSLSSPTLF